MITQSCPALCELSVWARVSLWDRVSIGLAGQSRKLQQWNEPHIFSTACLLPAMTCLSLCRKVFFRVLGLGCLLTVAYVWPREACTFSDMIPSTSIHVPGKFPDLKQLETAGLVLPRLGDIVEHVWGTGLNVCIRGKNEKSKPKQTEDNCGKPNFVECKKKNPTSMTICLQLSTNMNSIITQ